MFQLFAPCRGVERAGHPVGRLVHPFRRVDGCHSHETRTVGDSVHRSVVTPAALFRDTPADSTSLSMPSLRVWDSQSGRVPCESVDAPDNLPQLSSPDTRTGSPAHRRPSASSRQSVAGELIRDFQYGPIAAPMTASTESPVPSANSSTLPNTSPAVIPVQPRVCATHCLII